MHIFIEFIALIRSGEASAEVEPPVKAEPEPELHEIESDERYAGWLTCTSLKLAASLKMPG